MYHKADSASSFLVWVSPSWKLPATWNCPMVGRAGSSCARDTCPLSSLLVSGGSEEPAITSFWQVVSSGRGYCWTKGPVGTLARHGPASSAGLSSELRSVLTMMLEPDPQLRATAEALLALPMLRQPRPWNVVWYMAAEALSRGWALWQVSLHGAGLSYLVS